MPPVYTRFRTKWTPYPFKGNKIRCGTFYRRINDEWQPVSPGYYSTDPNHDYYKAEICKDNVHKGPPWKDGGDFCTLKIVLPDLRVQGFGDYTTGANLVSDYTGTHQWRYNGGFTNPQFDGDGYAPNYFSFGNTDQLLRLNTLIPSTGDFGPEAYARMRPKLQNADILVDLAESRDIPRMLRRSAREFSSIFGDYYRSQTFGGRLLREPRGGRHIDWRLPPEIGDSFLNAQFGWAPFISSLKKLGDTYNRSSDLINQIKKNNAVWIKRKWVKDETTESTRLNYGTGLRCEPLGNTINQMCVNGFPPGDWELWRDVTTRVYAVGRYKYYRPEFDERLPSHNNMWNTVQRYAAIYGLRLNATNVYNATPWSWLIDYFTNTGDLVDQINDLALDGITTKYMYLMHTQTVSIRLLQRINFQSGSVSMQWSKNILTKQREGAGSPFDFRLTLPLSAKQLAVLSALGATRTSPSTWKFAR